MDQYKHIKTKENYLKVLKSGMFWEFHPELSGNWDKDSYVIEHGCVKPEIININLDCKTCEDYYKND